MPSRQRRLSRIVEKYLTNPVVRTALRVGIAPKTFALLETKGRHTGLPRTTPVGNGLSGATFWLVSERGLECDYVKNLVAEPRVRVRVGRRWRTGSATLLPADDGLARRRAIDEANGVLGRLDGVIFRATAQKVLTIRIDIDE